MTQPTGQPTERTVVGYALVIALWIVAGVVLHAVVQNVTRMSFAADFADLIYAAITVFLFFIWIRRGRNAS